jgi:glucose-1-phosphate cytidylyltransferase
MKALILAGGLGTRLSEETDVKPKPMVEIGGKPILWHIMKSYSHHGINDFIILLGYKGYVIKEFFVNYFMHQSDITVNVSSGEMQAHHKINENWKVTLLDTGFNTQTGSRVKKAKNYINNETFLLTYGDGVGDINIKDTIAFHKNHGKYMTMTSAQPAGRFGSLKVDENNMLTDFNEKPQGDNSWINAGYFVCESKVLDYIEDRDDIILEQEPIKNLVKDQQLYTYKHKSFWMPMDTLSDKRKLNNIYYNQNAPWAVWENNE